VTANCLTFTSSPIKICELVHSWNMDMQEEWWPQNLLLLLWRKENQLIVTHILQRHSYYPYSKKYLEILSRYNNHLDRITIQMNVCTNIHIRTTKLYTKHSYPSCLILFNLKTCLLIPEYFMSGFTSRFILIWKLHKSIHFNLLQIHWKFLNKTQTLITAVFWTKSPFGCFRKASNSLYLSTFNFSQFCRNRTNLQLICHFDITIQWTLESQTVWFSNNLKLEQKIREKFSLKLK
jgi:hypothetical protein